MNESKKFHPEDPEKDRKIIDALTSGNDLTFFKRGGVFQENYAAMKQRILDYLSNVDVRRGLEKYYHDASEELRNGKPDSAIDILENDYLYLEELQEEFGGDEKELKKIKNFLDFLKNHFEEDGK